MDPATKYALAENLLTACAFALWGLCARTAWKVSIPEPFHTWPYRIVLTFFIFNVARYLLGNCDNVFCRSSNAGQA